MQPYGISSSTGSSGAGWRPILYVLIVTVPDDAYMAVANMLPLGENGEIDMNRQHPSLTH